MAAQLLSAIAERTAVSCQPRALWPAEIERLHDIGIQTLPHEDPAAGTGSAVRFWTKSGFLVVSAGRYGAGERYALTCWDFDGRVVGRSTDAWISDVFARAHEFAAGLRPGQGVLEP